MNSAKLFFAICIILIFLTAASARAEVLSFSKIQVPAVTSEGKGVLTDLEIELVPGKGRLLLNTEPFAGIQTQNSERVAASIAQNFTGANLSDTDIVITFRAQAYIVDGPSAGAAMAVLMIATMQNKTLRNDTSLTGTIQPDGTIGPVGSIFEKAEAAAKEGYRIFLIPKGQELQAYTVEKEETPSPGFTTVRSITQYRNVTRYAAEQWNMKVIQVSRISEIYDIMIGLRNITINVPLLQANEKLENATMPDDLVSFSNIAKEMINNASSELAAARATLAKSQLSTQAAAAVEDILLQADGEYGRAKVAIGSNYLYGAANHAFRSEVFSKSGRDIAKYSALATADEKLNFIKKRQAEASDLLEKTKAKMSDINYYSNDTTAYEWAAASQNRLAQAELQNSMLLQTENVFYALALIEGWSDIASGLYGIAKEKSGNAVFHSAAFKNESLAVMQKLDLVLFAYTAEPPRGVPWLNNVTQWEYSKGWYLAAYIDGNIALSRIESQRALRIRDFSSYISYIENAISKVDEKKSSWAKLYKDQASLMMYYAKSEGDIGILDGAIVFAGEAKLFADLNDKVSSLPSEKKPLSLASLLLSIIFIAAALAIALIVIYSTRVRGSDIRPTKRRL